MEAESHDNRDRHIRRRFLPRGCLIAIICIIFLLLIGIALARPVCRLWITWNYSPKHLALIDEHLKKPIDVPKEWFSEKPYSDQLLQDMDRFDAEVSAFLASDPDEERLAESRRADADTMILPSPLAPRVSEPAGLPAESMRKLQDTLRELQECRRLLDAAVSEAFA